MNPADRQTLARKLEFLRKQCILLDEYRALSKDDVLSSVDSWL